MSHLRTLNIYQNKICIRCGHPAIGLVSDSWATRYYCQEHYSKVSDLWQTAAGISRLEATNSSRGYRTPKRVPIVQQSLFPALV